MRYRLIWKAALDEKITPTGIDMPLKTIFRQTVSASKRFLERMTLAINS
ncbi:hypothetical protein GHK96_18385 [Vibrio cholerae]|nr:hypothetical protein [Vibrio cholerae]MBW5419897.1 hypothetical protein [Vibrio cholerae]